jgi:hypothetical protein
VRLGDLGFDWSAGRQQGSASRVEHGVVGPIASSVRVPDVEQHLGGCCGLYSIRQQGFRMPSKNGFVSKNGGDAAQRAAKPNLRAAIAQLHKLSKGVRLGNIRLRDLIEEGRKS